MKRSEINRAFRDAGAFFAAAGWALPPEPRWDITDCGSGDFFRVGLTLVNLAEEPEYCEKIMFSYRGQVTPAHTHRVKKEDIICRRGELAVQLWPGVPLVEDPAVRFAVPVNGVAREVGAGEVVTLGAGERVTLVPGVYHSFWAASEGGCMIGEVSTANDDAHDNVFADESIGRFPAIEEDEPAAVRLVSEGV